jgi:hypothetical protein
VMRTLIGPVRWAIKFGMMRPTRDKAFRIESLRAGHK